MTEETTQGGGGSSSKSSPAKDAGVSIEDFDVPKSHISKALKAALPEGTSIQKDARLAFMKATTVFINYITSAANDLVRQSNLKTITPDMVCKALETSDLDSLVPKVREALNVHKEVAKQKRQKAQGASSETGPKTSSRRSKKGAGSSSPVRPDSRNAMVHEEDVSLEEGEEDSAIPKKRDSREEQEEEPLMGDAKRFKQPEQEASSPYKSISALVNP